MTITTIFIIALVTFLIRLSPFVIFSKHAKTPDWIKYLGKFLSPAVMGMLIILSIKDINMMDYSKSMPILISVSSTILIHVWKRNNLISIIGGTSIYMILVQNIF